LAVDLSPRSRRFRAYSPSASNFSLVARVGASSSTVLYNVLSALGSSTTTTPQCRTQLDSPTSTPLAVSSSCYHVTVKCANQCQEKYSTTYAVAILHSYVLYLRAALSRLRTVRLLYCYRATTGPRAGSACQRPRRWDGRSRGRPTCRCRPLLRRFPFWYRRHRHHHHRPWEEGCGDCDAS
jgi:hypothetical protein